MTTTTETADTWPKRAHLMLTETEPAGRCYRCECGLTISRIRVEYGVSELVYQLNGGQLNGATYPKLWRAFQAHHQIDHAEVHEHEWETAPHLARHGDNPAMILQCRNCPTTRRPSR